MLAKIQINNVFKMLAGKVHYTAGFATLADTFHNKRFVRAVIQPRLECLFYLSSIHNYTFSRRLLCNSRTFSCRLLAQSYTFSAKFQIYLYQIL